MVIIVLLFYGRVYQFSDINKNIITL